MSDPNMQIEGVPIIETNNQQFMLDLAAMKQVTDPALLALLDTGDEESPLRELKNGTGGANGETLLDKKKQVIMSNRFVIGIETGSLLAFKISRIAIAQIPMNATELPRVKISTDDMMEMGYTRQRLTSHMNEIVEEVLNYRIKLAYFDTLHAERSQITGVNVFSLCTAKPGAIYVDLNPQLQAHFLNQRRDYTQYALNVVTQMNSFVAAKLHEILICRARQYGVSLLRFHLDDLRLVLKPTKTAKPKKSKADRTEDGAKRKEHRESPGVFLNNYIKKAVEVINANTECNVYYTTIREGHKIKDIRFYVEDFGSIEAKERAMKLNRELGREEEELERIRALLESGEGEFCPEEIHAKSCDLLPPSDEED